MQLVLSGCAHWAVDDSAAMNRPMQFESSSQFYRVLQSLETQISEANYQRLTDAIGYLQAHDLENLDYEDFHNSLAGLTPNEIIQKAQISGEGK